MDDYLSCKPRQLRNRRANATGLVAVLASLLLANASLALSLEEYVRDAFEAQQDPGLVTRQLILQGHDAARSAEMVSRVWGNCGASQAAVAVAVLEDPAAASDVVSAVGTGTACSCSAGGGWTRTRLEGRTRFDVGQRPVALSDSCSCMTAAIEAGVAALPQRADHIVMAGIEALQQETTAIDSIGTRGAVSEGWLSQEGTTQPLGFRRRASVCRGDDNETDTFDPQREWTSFQPPQSSGAYDSACSSDERGLLIGEFVADSNGAGYIELFNGTKADIDLAAEGYRVGISYAEQLNHNVLVPLTGKVVSGQSYTVAARTSDRAAKADQIVNRLGIVPGDAVSLHRTRTAESCECTEGVLAGALRGGQSRVAGTEQRNAAAHKLSRLMGTNEHANGLVVDAVGQVWQGAEQSQPLTRGLVRAPGWCQPDSYELDLFASEPGWRAAPIANDNTRCERPESDMLIREFQISGQGHDAVTLHNGSTRAIDFQAGAYYLEIYRQGQISPHRELALDGRVEPGQSFVLVHSEAEHALRDRADLLHDAIDLQAASAVVLARRRLDRPLACHDAVDVFMEGPIDGPVLLIDVATIEGRRPAGEPPRLDPLASPN